MKPYILASGETTTVIRATAHLEAAGTDSGNVTVRGPGYLGGEMKVPGWPRVVIDLAGMATGDRVPLQADHSSSVASRLGSAEAKVEGGRLTIAGEIVPGSELADRAIRLAKSGGVSLSVGVRPGRTERVAQGATVNVNGRDFAGPIDVVRESELIELSVVGVPADRGAHVIAASGGGGGECGEGDGPVLAERKRCREIRAAFRGVPGGEKNADELIEAGATVELAKATALALVRASRPSGAFIHAGGGSADVEPARQLSASLLLAAGSREAAERQIKDERVLASAEELCLRAGGTYIGLMREGLALFGVEAPRGTNELIRAGFTNNAYTSAVADAINLVGLDALQTAAEPVLQFAARKSVPNFKPATIARFAPTMQLHQVAPGGELQHIQLGGETSTVTADTYGAICTIDRKSVIDDDLSHFQEIPMQFGREAARTIGDVVWDLVSAGVGSFFASGNANYLSGAPSALSKDALADAIVKLRSQTDSSGRRLNLIPRYLWVAPEEEMDARAIVNSSELRDPSATAATPIGNPLKGVCEVLVDARLTSPEWLLLSTPENAAIVLALLKGQLRPTIEAVDPGFSVLGIGFRSYIDFGAALHEHRAAVYSKGEA